LNEYSCSDEGTLSSTSINCPNGCSNGVCLGSASTTNVCTDSDGGKNYYARGTVTGIGIDGSPLDLTDICEGVDGKEVHEYYCKIPNPNGDNYDKLNYYYINYLCPKGCNNGACILDLDPIVHYNFSTRFIRPIGDIADSSGYENHGTSKGYGSLTVTNPMVNEGVDGNASYFTGSAGQTEINTSLSSNFKGDSVSYSFWFYPIEIGREQALISQYSGNDDAFEVFEGESNNLWIGNYNNFIESPCFSLFNWHHVYAERNSAGYMKLYMDGSLVAQGNGSRYSGKLNTAPLNIGHRNTITSSR
jgi:hypothetical protein